MNDQVAEYVRLGEAAMEREEYEFSVESFNQGLAIAPKDFAALFGMAEVLRFKEDYAEAADYYRQAQIVDPEQFYGHWEMAYSYDMAGNFNLAKAGYEECLRRNPDHGVARHLLSALLGETMAAAPQDYVEELFDDYAETFDESLVNDLDYAVPDLMHQKLKMLDANPHYATALDLGCGTGLVGAKLSEVCDEIHGVDLSAKMIEQAESKNIYRRTKASEVVSFLKDGDLGVKKYDLILAGDVFVYLGDLEPLFKFANRRLKITGRFLFTVEKYAPEDDEAAYKIQRSGRYAHSREYITSQSQLNKFLVESIDEIIPRKEGETLISGYLCSLVKLR